MCTGKPPVRKEKAPQALAACWQPCGAASRANERWSLDFASDGLASGRTIRVLSIMDTYTRECLALDVDTSFPSPRAGAASIEPIFNSLFLAMKHSDLGVRRRKGYRAMGAIIAAFLLTQAPFQDSLRLTSRGVRRGSGLVQTRIPCIWGSRSRKTSKHDRALAIIVILPRSGICP